MFRLRSPNLACALFAPLALVAVVASLVTPSTARADEEDPKGDAPVKRTGRASDSAPIPSSDEHVHYALRLDGRGLFVPMSVVSPFLKEGQSLTSGSIGASFVRRKGALDVVVSVDL